MEWNKILNPEQVARRDYSDEELADLAVSLIEDYGMSIPRAILAVIALDESNRRR